MRITKNIKYCKISSDPSLSKTVNSFGVSLVPGDEWMSVYNYFSFSEWEASYIYFENGHLEYIFCSPTNHLNSVRWVVHLFQTIVSSFLSGNKQTQLSALLENFNKLQKITGTVPSSQLFPLQSVLRITHAVAFEFGCWHKYTGLRVSMVAKVSGFCRLPILRVWHLSHKSWWWYVSSFLLILSPTHLCRGRKHQGFPWKPEHVCATSRPMSCLPLHP